jgi:hypothetical protein
MFFYLKPDPKPKIPTQYVQWEVRANLIRLDIRHGRIRVVLNDPQTNIHLTPNPTRRLV